MMTKINVVGDGAFGSFLMGLFSQVKGIELADDAEIVVLAVPFSAYDDVAAKYAGKYLVNVCSIQDDSTKICLRHSRRVLSIHPMFGARTPPHMQKTCIVTYNSGNSAFHANEIIRAFRDSGAEIVTRTPDGDEITPKWHDMIMANSHLRALEIAEMAAPMLEGIMDIPDKFFPATVVNLRNLVKQLQDMPPGTRDSIKANPYK